MMAGRNISASYVAFTSARVMATCAVEGQAIGTAAAQCVETGIDAARSSARDPKQVARLQQTLLRDDQTIKGRRNQDPADLARAGDRDRLGRRRRGQGGARARRLHARHSRTSAAIPSRSTSGRASAPAWIELRWDRPRRIREVQITFDSGFQRQLTLTAQESQNVNLRPRAAARDGPRLSP